MFKIKMIGEIGWDVYPFMIEEQLSEANGGDIEIDLSSPGGVISKGLIIADLFKQYRVDNPNSIMKLNIKSEASSMASHVAALSVFYPITVEETTLHMRHNPQGYVGGDYIEVNAAGSFLERYANVMAIEYSRKSKMSMEDTKKDMNKTTYLFGKEIVEAGFADEVVKIENQKTMKKDEAILMSKDRFETVMQKVKNFNPEKEEVEKAMSMINKLDKNDIEPPPTPQTPATGGKNNTQEVTKMGDENKKPEIDAKEIEKAGYDRGITSEKERVTSLLEMKKKKDFEGITAIHDRIDEAIANGENVQDVHTFVNATSMKGGAFAAALDTNAVGDISQPASTTLSGEAGTAEEKKLIEANSTF